MSYRCQECGNLILPNVQSFRKVVETRDKTYPTRQGANRFVRRERQRTPGAGRPVWPENWRKEGGFIVTDDTGGVGWETVKEILVCTKCRPSVQKVPVQKVPLVVRGAPVAEGKPNSGRSSPGRRVHRRVPIANTPHARQTN